MINSDFCFTLINRKLFDKHKAYHSILNTLKDYKKYTNSHINTHSTHMKIIQAYRKLTLKSK